MPNGPWGSSSTPAAITPSFTDLVPGTSTTWGGITGPVSAATALYAVFATLASPAFTGTVTGITAAMVGALGLTAQAADSAKLGGQLPGYYQTALGFTPINKAGDSGIGNLSMGALTATGIASSSGITVNGVSFISASSMSIAVPATFASSVSMGALTATSGTFSGSVTAQSFTDNYITWGFAQINRAGANIELQYAGGASSQVRIGGGGSNPITLNANTGSVSMGALTATSGTFSGSVQIGVQRLGLGTFNGNDSDTFATRNAKGCHFGRSQGASDAPGGETSTYFQYIQLPEVNGAYSQAILALGATNSYIGYGSWNATPTWAKIYTSSNINSQVAALQALQSMVNAPFTCTNATVPSASDPRFGTAPNYGYIYVTDDYSADGKAGTMYKSNGSSWVMVGASALVAGRIIAGNITAGSIGTVALATQLALVGQYISSAAFSSGGAGYGTWGVPGNNTGTPSGFAIYASPISSKYADGTTDTVIAEFGGNVSIGGYKAAVIANRVMGNSPSWTSNSTWTCPEGITKVSLTLQGAGANGAAGVSVGNAGGGGGCGAYLQRSITVTPGTVYYISFDSGTVNFRTGGYSGTILYSAAIGGAASAPTHGNNGSAYYQPTPELLVPIPTTAGIDGQPWTGSGPTINYGGAGGISPFDASGYGSGGKGQDILKAGGVSGVAGTGMPGFARIIY